MNADPYPQTLADVDDYPPLAPVSEADAMVRAINRLAQAVEQNTLALLDQRPAQPVQRAPLQALPPVQTVGAMPPCPAHGLDKVRSSTQGPGFYCSAKAMPGQPQNAKGYCTWHS